MATSWGEGASEQGAEVTHCQARREDGAERRLGWECGTGGRKGEGEGDRSGGEKGDEQDDEREDEPRTSS